MGIAMRARARIGAAVVTLVGLLALASVLTPASARTPNHGTTVDIQLLALNDFHGALEPPPGSGGRIGSVNAGGVEYLATHIRELEATNPRNTVVVSAGDLIGASPLISALFHDEPTIEAMNALGLDLNAVGNHEFDEGTVELLRMQYGGCHPTDGCQDGDGFGGADFGFLAANVVETATGETLLPPYAIRTFQGARVAFIGMTLEGTPEIVSRSGIAGYEFRDEADTVNALVPHLLRRSVDIIVVLLHEGGVPAGGYNECPGISGPIVDLADRMSDAVDVIVSGHTHQAYNCVIDGKVVTSAASNGRLVTDIDLSYDKASKQLLSVAANNRIMTRDVARDAAQTALIDKYRALAAPLADRVIGTLTAPATRERTAAGESVLGNLIADAQLAATQVAGAQVAFMNPGGIRADLDAGEVTYGEAFTVQPFGNSLITLTLTGAQIERLLELQFCESNAGASRILQVSEGFSYTWDDDPALTACNRVDPASITLDGAVVDPAGTYRVTVNSFLADGGDGFSVLREGTNRDGGALDLDAMEAYLSGGATTPPGTGRITVI